MKVIKAEVMGICQGVRLALKKTNDVIKNSNEPIFLLGNLVHNELLMDSLKKQGVQILKDGSLNERINSIDQGTIIFSAHGHDKNLDELALKKGLKIIDTTCPKVSFTMQKIEKDLKNGYSIIYIGVKNHPEANAILSLSNEIIFIDFKDKKYPKIRLDSLKIYNQTTLSIFELEQIHNDLKNIYPNAIIENDICNATTLRQKSLLSISDDIHYILIIGDKSSSNTLRLYELCKDRYKDKEILFTKSLDDIKNIKIDNSKSIFVTAGASTTDLIIDPIINYLKNL